MIVFVDYEHAEGRATAWGEKLLAARTWITYRLEDLAGMPCLLVRYDHITPELLEQVGARAVFISGNGTDPSRYEPASLRSLHSIIVDGEVPIFGFCGGFQCMAQALGTELRPIEAETDGHDADRLRPFADGRLGEIGYLSVDLVADHALFDGIDAAPVFRHAHHLEVPVSPSGFRTIASSSISAVQMAVDDDRRLVGTQFHPEYFTDEHPAGQLLISNFLHWAGVLP